MASFDARDIVEVAVRIRGEIGAAFYHQAATTARTMIKDLFTRLAQERDSIARPFVELRRPWSRCSPGGV